MNAALQGTQGGQSWAGGLEAVKECPACGDHRRQDELEGLTDMSFGSAPGQWALKRCLGCQVMYLDPRPDPHSLYLAYREYYTHQTADGRPRFTDLIKSALKNGYRNKYFGIALRPSLAAGALLLPFHKELAQQIRWEDRGLGRPPKPQSRLLDVGCGSGQFLALAKRLGWLAYGVEPDAHAAAVARSQGCSVMGSDVSDLRAQHFEGLFDLLTLNHVIEHVYDPVGTLRHCWRVIKPGGRIWLETPSIKSMGYEIYGAAWRGLEVPRHLVLFNPQALVSCLQRAGFERIALLPPREIGNGLYTISARMQLGRIGERERGTLPRQVRAEVVRAAGRARQAVNADPARAEYITAVAYKPG